MDRFAVQASAKTLSLTNTIFFSLQSGLSLLLHPLLGTSSKMDEDQKSTTTETTVGIMTPTTESTIGEGGMDDTLQAQQLEIVRHHLNF